MTRNPSIFTKISTCFLLAAVGASSALAASEPPSLGPGEISLQMKQLDATSLAVVVENSLPDVAAIVVQVPGQDQDLVRISTQTALQVVTQLRAPRPARATASTSTETVAGKISLVVVHNLEGVTHVQLLVVTTSGQVVPLDLHSPSFTNGARFATRFAEPWFPED